VGQISKSRGKKIMVPIDKIGLVIWNTYMIYESPITYLSKDMTNVNISADRQTDGQTKNHMLPDLSIRGHKMLIN
jgi:hypothetical protein